MAMNGSKAEKQVRLEVFREYEKTFSTAPIRLMSRTAARMQALGYSDLSSAIGDLDWRTVPYDDPEDPGLRDDWGRLLSSAFDNAAAWLQQLSSHPLGYNLDSLGYPAVVRAWSRVWADEVGLEFDNRSGEKPQVYMFHGGNQALQAALLGVSEAHREGVGNGRPARVLVPIPSFSCPLDQMALQGLEVVFLPPVHPGMDPHPDDLERLADGETVDAVYLMPINNPTGRTVPPAQLRAFVDAVLDRWPEAAIILDSVYVRLHPDHRELLSWYDDDGSAYDDNVVFIDSLSKTHGVTGLRTGVLLTRSERLATGIHRYAQNVMAGPSNMMQAVTLALLLPRLTGDDDMASTRLRLQLRIGRHMQRRRRVFLREAFDDYGDLLDGAQPVLTDPETFDWPGSLYAVVRLGDRCLELAEECDVAPTVAFYLETGIAGVPLSGFCNNPALVRHGLVLNAADEKLQAFQEEADRYVRLSFGMTAPRE